MYTLYNEDCLIAMKNIPDSSVDMILTDLPYGVTDCEYDSVIAFDKLWKEYKRISKEDTPILLFGDGNIFTAELILSNKSWFKYNWILKKVYATGFLNAKKQPLREYETISVFYKKQCTYNPQMVKYEGPLRTNKVKDGKLGTLIDNNEKKPFEYQDKGVRYPLQIVQFKRDILTSNLHPTQKPVALMEYLVKTYTNEGDTVLDFTMGSGTTGVACKNLNRNFIGIELDKNYFEIAKDRIGV